MLDRNRLEAKGMKVGLLESTKAKIAYIKREVEEKFRTKSSEEKIELMERFNLLMVCFMYFYIQRYVYVTASEGDLSEGKYNEDLGCLCLELDLLTSKEIFFDSESRTKSWEQNTLDYCGVSGLLPENFIDLLDIFKEKSFKALDDDFDGKINKLYGKNIDLKDSTMRDCVSEELSLEISRIIFDNPKTEFKDKIAIAQGVGLSRPVGKDISTKYAKTFNKAGQRNFADILITLKKPYLIYVYAMERNITVLDESLLDVTRRAVKAYQANASLPGSYIN